MKSTETNAYARGYAAGTKRTDKEFERAVFLAVLPELIRSPWHNNGVVWKTIDQFVEGAAQFAAKAVRRI